MGATVGRDSCEFELTAPHTQCIILSLGWSLKTSQDRSSPLASEEKDRLHFARDPRKGAGTLSFSQWGLAVCWQCAGTGTVVLALAPKQTFPKATRERLDGPVGGISKTLSCCSTEREECSGSTTQCCDLRAYSRACSHRRSISRVPGRNTSASPRSWLG